MDLNTADSDLKMGNEDSSNSIKYSPYSNRPSLDDLVLIARSAGSSPNADRAVEVIIETYVSQGAYIDLNNMVNDIWLDNSYRNAAKSKVVDAMKSNYNYHLSKNPSTYAVSYNNHFDSLNPNIKFFGFEGIAKDVSLSIHDRMEFSKYVLDSWIKDGSHKLLYNFSQSYSGKISSKFPAEILSLVSNKEIDKAAKNKFQNLYESDIVVHQDEFLDLLSANYVSEDIRESHGVTILENNFDNSVALDLFDSIYSDEKFPESVLDFVENSRDLVSNNIYVKALNNNDYDLMHKLQTLDFISDEVKLDVESNFDSVVSAAYNSAVEKNDYSSLFSMSEVKFLSKSQRNLAKKAMKKMNRS